MERRPWKFAYLNHSWSLYIKEHYFSIKTCFDLTFNLFWPGWGNIPYCVVIWRQLARLSRHLSACWLLNAEYDHTLHADSWKKSLFFVRSSSLTLVVSCVPFVFSKVLKGEASLPLYIARWRVTTEKEEIQHFLNHFPDINSIIRE